MNGSELIAAERARQITEEGWTPEKDSEHDNGALGKAALAYAWQAIERGWVFGTEFEPHYQCDEPPDNWPFDDEEWKPTNPVRDLVKAGSLIAAEIDRRLALSSNAALSGRWPKE